MPRLIVKDKNGNVVDVIEEKDEIKFLHVLMKKSLEMLCFRPSFQYGQYECVKGYLEVD